MDNQFDTNELTAVLLDENSRVTLRELCQACALTAEQVTALMDEGVVEAQQVSGTLYFSGVCVRKVHRMVRLEQDLGVNHAGAALALELLEEIEQLRARIRRLERH
ncbi:MerR family transcriptional regulator [Microbulbifer sp. SH-1]|uniref:chaperone modulator CbpM n=1 Tax=Microbulbifer sp. SH-1 TaxID=2681547 RepID=UPI00140AB608|nr:chaperone modulator CbpM [Microbulbifer sp. SH-1]QIL88820.1 MerR family transcriptional regulator [Microbulbifer sp. SH-1]